MKYLNKQFFYELDIIKIIFLIILQIFGVASIWGYSEILGWRVGYDANWAVVVIIFMFLSTFRIILSNYKQVHKWIFVNSMMDPPTALKSNKKSILSILGIIYSLTLDFVLQILGVASIWAYSEITGNRVTPFEWHKWGIVTMIFSFISFIRYVLKFRRNYHQLDLPTNFTSPTYFWEYFEIGFVSTLANKKIIMKTILIQLGIESNLSGGQPIPLSTRETEQSSTQDITFSNIDYISIISFFIGYLCHLTLSFILEWMGSGGAIWGISEVMTLRKTPTSLTFKILAIITSCSVSLNSIKDFYSKYFHTNKLLTNEINSKSSYNNDNDNNKRSNNNSNNNNDNGYHIEIKSQLNNGHQKLTEEDEENNIVTTHNPLNSY